MEKKAADILTTELLAAGADVGRQEFLSPETYIWEVLWLTLLIAAGLVTLPLFSWLSAALLVFCAVSAFLMFDWRASPFASLCPRVPSENIIADMKSRSQGQEKTGAERQQLILMAHYDSAPVSLLYLPSMVKNFRSSLIINLALIVLTIPISVLGIIYPASAFILWTARGLALYFLIQGGITAFDYLKYGYSNGASDNATGTAAAMVTAQRLWNDPVPGMDVTLVLTGAEETGMTGAKYFFNARNHLFPEETFVLNFDSLGRGDLKIITKTGSITTIDYKGSLIESALGTAASDKRFYGIKPAAWHTGDFDTLWFARAGIPCLTLTAQDKSGLIPHLHRPEDRIENIDPTLTRQAVDFAEALIRKLPPRQR